MHMDELVEVYLERFVEILVRCGCDTLPFTRHNFEEQLKKYSQRLLFYSISAVKFMTMDITSDLDADEMMSKGIMTDGNKLFFERTWIIISKYISKGWL